MLLHLPQRIGMVQLPELLNSLFQLKQLREVIVSLTDLNIGLY